MSENKLICIVDDDASVRDSLSLVLGLKGYDCRTYESAESFLSSLPNRPACIILDLKMTGMNGLELQNRLLSLKVPLQIIFLTAFADVQVMREAFLGNAVDFLEKPFVLEQLLESINRSLNNLSATTEITEKNQKLSLLTPREKEVFDVLAQGKSHREIGELLKISPRTVEVHKARVLEKLGIKSLSDILRIAIKT
jgi:RNA polymerase sigma factor (sigma-70 family)